MKTTRNLWPFAIIGIFALFIAGMTTMVVLACRSNTDLVSRDYYEQELRFQGRIDSLDRTHSLGATAKYDAPSRRIIISLPAAHAGKSVDGQIQLYRPSAAGMDRQFKLKPDAQGIQALDAADLENGLWKIRVAWNVAGQEYFLDRKMIVGSALAASGASAL